MKDWVEIGYVARAHGIKGEFVVKLYDVEFEFLHKNLEMKVGEQSIQLKEFRPHKEGLIFKAFEVEDRNAAEALRSCKVFVSQSVFSEISNESFYLNQVLGFEVFNYGKLMGKVSGFASSPAHDFIKVKNLENKEVEIPYTDSFIESVKKEEKKIYLNCPEELFDFDFFNPKKGES